MSLGSKISARRSRNQRGSQLSAISGQPETSQSGGLCTLKGWHITAQGRDALVAHPGSTSLARMNPERVPHRTAIEPCRARGQPLQGWRATASFPRVRSCVATLGWDVKPLRGTDYLLALVNSRREQKLGPLVVRRSRPTITCRERHLSRSERRHGWIDSVSGSAHITSGRSHIASIRFSDAESSRSVPALRN